VLIAQQRLNLPAHSRLLRTLLDSRQHAFLAVDTDHFSVRPDDPRHGNREKTDAWADVQHRHSRLHEARQNFFGLVQKSSRGLAIK
jgi:hypothetical protein